MKKILGLILCFAACVVCGQTQISKILPLVSDDNIKLEITLRSASQGERALTGRITSCKTQKVIWEGEIRKVSLPAGKEQEISCRIDNIKAELWSPTHPNLYTLEVRCDGAVAAARIGFRKFEMIDGQFHLNGKPIFLRGNAINPPGRGIPEELEKSRRFAIDYIRFLKGMNINIIRIPDNQDWMDVCDEEGMMLFGGCYGTPKGGTANEPPPDIEAAVERYKKTDLGPFARHPSMVIYTLSNEQATDGERGEKYRNFFKKAYDELIKWDDTKLYICNAGYGMGRSADVYDVHRYWGWYHNTHLTYLSLRDVDMWQNPGRTQAITFTECVGNYTGIDGRYNISARTKQPGAQKCWTGHLPPEQQAEAALAYQTFLLKQSTEMFRRMRSSNPRLGGIMPFTIMFYNWDDVHSFAGMRPKPVAYQYCESYQPVLLSWETWQTNVFAGKEFSVVAHVVNDDDNCADLKGAKVMWVVEKDGFVYASGSHALPDVSYYGTSRRKMGITLSPDAPTGYYKLKGTVIVNGKQVSQNSADLFVAGKEWRAPVAAARPVKIYDPNGDCAKALDVIGVKYEKTTDISKLDPADSLFIGEHAWDGIIGKQTKALSDFAKSGGRIVCLRQTKEFDTKWLPVPVDTLKSSNSNPVYPSPDYTYCDGININIERRDHAIFKGLTQDMFRIWSDYTRFDESRPGLPAIYPVTNGFLMRQADFTKVTLYANFSRNLTGVALCEINHGKGSIILSGFDLTSRCGVDPVAEKMFANLVGYAAGREKPEPYRFVDKPIIWGDYGSENGIVTGANNGLVVNPYPIIPLDQQDGLNVEVDSRGYHLAGARGGWNTRPGIQYVPRGRRPFGPFTFSWGGNDVVRGKDLSKGTGYFLARVSDGRTKMLTTFENNSDDAIKASVQLNTGALQEVAIAPHSQAQVVTKLPPERELKIIISGDRRTVLLRSEFL